MQSASASQQRRRSTSITGTRRSHVACLNCRNSKIKCAGSPPNPCISCEVKQRECRYPRMDKRKYVSENYLRHLQSKVKTLEAGRPRSSTKDTSSMISDEGDDNVSADAVTGDDDLDYNEGDNLFLCRSGEHYYVGTASSTFLATRLDPSSQSASWDINPQYSTASWPRHQPIPILVELPPQDVAMGWYKMQSLYIGTIFSFVQPRHFEARLKQVYSQPVPDTSSMEDCLAYCQILLLLAYGQLYSVNQWSSKDGPPGFAYFKDALHFLPDLHEEGSILFVEVLSLVGYYFQVLNRRDAAFNYIGCALRMAISLGLHREVPNQDIDHIEREHRRRVWWSVYSMDRILCVKWGNPITIHDEDIDVAQPSYLADFDNDPSPARVLLHYTDLSRILGKVGEGIYRKRRNHTGTNLMQSVRSIMNDLSRWVQDLPDELRLDFDKLDGTPISREVVSTWLHYYQCENMTARPLLFYVSQRRLEALANGTATENWTEGLSTNVVAVINKIIAGARASTLIANAAAKQGLFATYGFMDGEHAFSAALILVMANMAFPYDRRNALAMESAMAVLKMMAERGNQHMRARHALLDNLRHTVGMGGGEPSDTKAQGVPEKSNSMEASMSLPMHTVSEVTQQPLPNDDGSFSWEDSNTLEQTTTATQPPAFDFSDSQAMNFSLDIDEDPVLWDEMSRNIAIDMDTGWIENHLLLRQDTVTPSSSPEI